MRASIHQALLPILRLMGLLLVLLSLSRAFLICAFWERVSQQGHLGFIFLQGIRFDIILLGLLFTVPALTIAASAWHAAALRVVSRVLAPLLTLGTALAVFVEAASLPFIRQYDARPNILFVEYLRYPGELAGTLLADYLLPLLLSGAVVGLTVWLSWRICRRGYAAQRAWRRWQSLVMIPVIAVAALAMIRSGNDHRPANPSLVAYSADSMVNELALNSPYSLLYAIYEQRRDGGSGIHYGEMPRDELISTVRSETGYRNTDFPDPEIPSLHFQKASVRRPQPLNMVIILEESLGAEFVGRLGGLSLTPELDKLADEGIWFDNLYATGTRSVRGIEAVITGFPPTSSLSVVKLAHTQRNFFTIAELLRRQGYATSFVYGGEAHFDNMRRFFMGNGFEHVIDEHDYDLSAYRGTWGVSDEALFDKAHEEFSGAAGQPFFSLVFTSSNHVPFDIPPGKVPVQPGAQSDLHTAIRYADFALGEFIRKARQAPYWDNTVFLVVADHNSRVYGDELVPVDRFHIPGLILGADIVPRHVTGVSSQIDLLPTLLSLVGVDSWNPLIGRDLSTPPNLRGSGRAIMQFNQIQAYLEQRGEQEELLILRPGLPPAEFSYSPVTGLGDRRSVDSGLLHRALGYSLWGPTAVTEDLYHLAAIN